MQRTKTTRTILTLTFILLTSLVSGAEGATLFKDYTFGMPKAHFQKMPGIEDATEYWGADALLLDNQTFLEMDVGLIFTFVSEKLVSVAVLTDFDPEIHLKLFGAITRKFDLVIIQNSNESLDLIELSKIATNGAG
ncbi:MAG: hypothetical protein GKR94_19140 [Gammaproteobacteria bacterium]|nr:hypothetical protein [Gammaproteobacteria bacterium]